jgi:hypothetical protein
VDDARETRWFTVGATKLMVMSVVTFGFYTVYWFYQQWKHERAATGEALQPLARAIFVVVFCYTLFRRIGDSARAIELPAGPPASLLAIIFIALSFTSRLPTPYWMLWLLAALPLVAVQRVANAVTLHDNPGADLNARLSRANVTGVAVGGGLTFLAVIGSVFPDGLVPATSELFLSTVATEMNKTLPRKLDDDTEFVAAFGRDGVLEYSYRLVNVTADQIDVAKLRATVKPELIKTACTTIETRSNLLKRGVMLQYAYQDKNRKEVMVIDIVDKDCVSVM